MLLLLFILSQNANLSTRNAQLIFLLSLRQIVLLTTFQNVGLFIRKYSQTSCIYLNSFFVEDTNQIQKIAVLVMNKRKIQPVVYGISRGDANHQATMIDLMQKLVSQSRDSNILMRELLQVTERKDLFTPQPYPHSRGRQEKDKRYQTNVSFYPSPNIPRNQFLIESFQQEGSNNFQGGNCLNTSNFLIQQKIQQPANSQEDGIKRILLKFNENLVEISKTNQKIYEKLTQIKYEAPQSEQKGQQNQPMDFLQNLLGQKQEQNDNYEQVLLQVFNKQNKIERKTYEHYGILSQIMPYSDKRQIKVRFKIIDLIERQELSEKTNLEELKQKTTEWVGMVFRATASICWNMLLGSQLNFEEVKVLFTENIIFNFIEYMKDIEYYINEEKRLNLTIHINYVSCEVLQFLCRQYPQTKVEAPNIALRKSIPKIENQGHAKYDLITMVCRDSDEKEDQSDMIQFKVREDKDYSSVIMKVINYMIDETETQYDHFEKIMTNIFEKIYLPKDKRSKLKAYESLHQNQQGSDSQYREKVKGYSSYVIGRKIPKNTPKYTKNQIQYGVFFVKAPSILRIITKWFEQLWEFANTPIENLKTSSSQIKDHEGQVINMSTRVKILLYQKVNEKLSQISTKIERLKTECYNMEVLLSDDLYTIDSKQIHLSEDQLIVGKYCSNLKNAISSYVCGQLSKIIYYLLLIPKEIDEKVLEFNDEDFQEQARKHLDSTNLVSLKIFDLLRCKCHSNEEEIIYIVEALKQFERDDPKFELVRVKDRLNQGTRDILINAQYDGGLVWEIQLAVTSHTDKKQDLLDKYNHFLYELKRTNLGPISECVSIWSSLEQRSIYFEQLNLKKKDKGVKGIIKHKRKQCNQNQIEAFSQFKRSIICHGCQQYFAIPLTSLLNVRCENCRMTYCGLCFYSSLSEMEKKKFMFQNFNKKKLLNSNAFHELQQYTDHKKPLPKQGFFIKKKFLNRELSYYKISKMDQDRDNSSIFTISFSQTIIRNGQIDIRTVNKEELEIIEKNGEYFLNSGKQINKTLSNIWIFYFKSKSPETITLNELEIELKDLTKAKTKYLNVLFQPNYMTDIKLHSKIFEKVRLLNNLKNVEDIEKYKITVYRFPHLTILAKLEIDQIQLQQLLVKKANRSTLKDFAQKKITIINMEQTDLTDQIDSLLSLNSQDISFYFTKVQKLYLADNNIEDISCIQEFKNLQSLSISKNFIKSLKGIEELTKLYYIKFDDNSITSILELKKLINLSYVSGNTNLIQSLEGIQDLHNLGTLSLCNNKIVEITQLTTLTKLKRAYLRDNAIESLQPIKQLPIRHLFIGNTSIDCMQISQLTFISRLKDLSLKNMRLNSIPNIFQKADKLQELKLSKNKICKIENLDNAVNLVRLDLSDNEIELIQNLETLQNIEMLNLKSNNITCVEGVKSFIEQLKVLQLQCNPLDDLSQYLIYQENSLKQMRLKYTEQSISQKAKEQLKNHANELGNKSESDN